MSNQETGKDPQGQADQNIDVEDLLVDEADPKQVKGGYNRGTTNCVLVFER